MNGGERAEAVIIGGGVAGAADAYFLAQEGIPSVLLEREDQLGSLTTARAAACFRAQWDRGEFARLVIESITFYERFGEETGLGDWDIGLRQQGWLFLCGTDDGPARCERFVEGHRRLGITDSEFLLGHEVRDRFPWVGKAATAGTFRSRDGWVSPYEVTVGFAKASGADVRLRTTALAISVNDGRVTGVVTDKGTIETGRVVIASGPFSAKVAATADVRLPVFPIRRQLAAIRNIPEVPPDGPMVADADTHAYWRVDGAGALLGMPLAEDPGEPTQRVPVDWDFPAIALEAAARMTPFWADVAARLNQDDVSVLAGQYTCTVDALPVLGRVPGVLGLFVHTGDNGWGIEAAPASARLVAGSVVGRSDGLGPYSLDRPLDGAKRRLVSNWP